MKNNVTVRKLVLQKELKYNGVTVLTYKIEYPEFQSSRYRVCLHKVNRFNKKNALDYQRYCQTELFEAAVEQYRADIENGYPIRVFEVIQTYSVTFMCACIISIYFDRYEYAGGAHGNTIRSSQSWNLQKCCLSQIYQLIRCCPDFLAYILSEVQAQIEEEPDIYFENYKELIAQTFCKDSFYITPGGVVVYYQQYDIAPYASGIREFLLPFSDCVLNPVRFC